MENNHLHLSDDPLRPLSEFALRQGASAAVFISSHKIPIDDGIPELCRKPQCEGYGASAKCPPHVPGPEKLKELIKTHPRALVFKIDFAREVLFSSQRTEAFRLLHFLAAEIEQSAVRMGYPDSRAFAGGSCKVFFCGEEPKCRVLSEAGECRNPDLSRPSMSGFGVTVNRLVREAGLRIEGGGGDTPEPAWSSLVGLVLIG